MAGTLGGIVTVVTLLGVLGSGVPTALWLGLVLGLAARRTGGGEVRVGQSDAQDHLPLSLVHHLHRHGGAILNTFGRFAVSSFTPVFLNITMIAAAWWIAPLDGAPRDLPWRSVSSSAVWSSFVPVSFLRQLNMLVWPKWGWHHPGVVKIRTLMILALFGVSVSQDQPADQHHAGLVSGYRRHQLSLLLGQVAGVSLGLFAVAISTVILPALARKHDGCGSG